MMRVCTQAIFIVLLLAFGLDSNAQKICDMGAARDWCDGAMLDDMEGIWEYPDDHTKVLLRLSATDSSKYDIIVVETPDVRLEPGEKIGYLLKSPAQDKFEMGVYRTKLNKGVLSELGKCYAQYSSKDDALLVQGRGLKLSLGSRWLLPAFWRMIRISIKDPLKSLPKGLVRIYPNAKRRTPDYL